MSGTKVAALGSRSYMTQVTQKIIDFVKRPTLSVRYVPWYTLNSWEHILFVFRFMLLCGYGRALSLEENCIIQELQLSISCSWKIVLAFGPIRALVQSHRPIREPESRFLFSHMHRVSSVLCFIIRFLPLEDLGVGLEVGPFSESSIMKILEKFCALQVR